MSKYGRQYNAIISIEIVLVTAAQDIIIPQLKVKPKKLRPVSHPFLYKDRKRLKTWNLIPG